MAMRRVSVAFLLLVATASWPAGAAFAHSSMAARAAAVASLRADFNGDGIADLAVGVPAESVGTIALAGAVNVLYGSPGGLTGVGSELFTQDTAGVGSNAEQGDQFGHNFAAGDFDNDGFADLAVGVPGEGVGGIQFAGAMNVLYGSPTGLSGAGSQLFTQDTTGVGSTAEEFDGFGSALTASDFNGDGAQDLAVGVPGESVGVVQEAGAVNVVFGTAGGLTGAGSQLFTQDTAGVGSTAEALDGFGAALTGARFLDVGQCPC
jgi:FG-GAP repeat